MNKISYYIGYSLVFVVIYGLYALGFVGIVLEIKDGQIPFIPMIFLMCLLGVRKLYQLAILLNLNSQINLAKNILLDQVNKNDDAEKIMNKINNNKFGGFN